LSDEVAPFSAAGRSAKPGTNAFISPRSFGCGCAALRDYLGDSAISARIILYRIPKAAVL